MPEKGDDKKETARPKRTKTLKVSNQIPPKRRREIERALDAHEPGRPEWDRLSGAKQHRFFGKRIKPGFIRQIEFPLLDVKLGDAWSTPVTIIHGRRPGPTITITGGVHGDEMVGQVAASLLSQTVFTGPGRPLDPEMMAGTVRLAPVLNPPGFTRQRRYFPDGRDLNREFPGSEMGSTTGRVAHRVLEELITGSDFLLDLHTAANGRDNLPQVRADLAHPPSNRIARAFGIEVILDSKGPKGSMRRAASRLGIGSLTYEGGGANLADHEAVQIAIHGILNVLRSLHVIPGNASRPKFRLLASGSTWVRADEGGLVDLFVSRGSFVETGEVIGRIVDPQRPSESADIISPSRGIFICTANNPIVTPGTPVGHLLPVTRGVKLIRKGLDKKTNRLIVSGSKGEPIWREDYEVEEIMIEGEWSGGGVDAEWQRDWQSSSELEHVEAAEEEDAD
ncbi:MAG: succinylglutamate desuccinylase/aspartoacylase family protein [Candidatus Poseidoniales archaeon]|nr:succinylglutamate desuccinylase/aspartoacylase family protein [Candidatus Poseidoniales archaeon]